MRILHPDASIRHQARPPELCNSTRTPVYNIVYSKKPQQSALYIIHEYTVLFYYTPIIDEKKINRCGRDPSSHRRRRRRRYPEYSSGIIPAAYIHNLRG